MFRDIFVTFTASPDLPSLVGATIVVDQDDYTGVHIAAKNLAEDFARVTKGHPSPIKKTLTVEDDGYGIEADTAIIVGSIQSNRLLQRLEKDGKLNFGAIKGKWESFTTAVVDRPFNGCRKALVIAGSDKRGAIFGIYTLSEQVGVSPWYWWADVPPKYHPDIYALPVTTLHGEPSVRFRGIFINDEAPALTGWVREKFGSYGSEFYKRVFELLLRLKANFMWPAMWPGYPNPGASFFVDDPDNQKVAHEYGIVMSTSHHEPMQRATNEWFADNPDGSWNWITNKKKITEFFDEGVRRAKGYESYFTLGMRGEYDRKMATDDPVAVVRDVIHTQRNIIREVHGKEDTVPQLLALYKEVQEQYEGGELDVPDDVTLLFADDNFGTIRRLPVGKEANRPGGAGIYYHFEYVGVPRSYKWINSNSLGKTWHQLQEAHRRCAKQIWVFNVGDIKPMEVPITFAMSLAWDINSVKPDSFMDTFKTMADREFGSQLSQEVATAWLEYDRLASLRRHEHIGPQTFSLVHYNEADDVLARWKALLATAEAIHSHTAEDQKAAIFELVLHPIKASYIFVALQITLGRNQLYARQRRNSANKLAQQVLDLFDADFSLSQEFHALLNGKWNHIMRQTHYGFSSDTWHAPSRDMISGLCFVQRRQDSNPVMGQMGIMVEGHEGVRPGLTNEESDRTHPSRRDLVPGVTLGPVTRYGPERQWLEIFTRGTPTIHWKASVPYPWIHLSTSAGTLVPGEDDVRVEISVNWGLVPEDFNEEVVIDVRSEEGDFEQIHLPIVSRRVPETFKDGFVESTGYISIPASACKVEHPYRVLPEAGRESTGSVVLQADFGSTTDQPPEIFLTYKVYVFSDVSSAILHLHFNMTLDLDPSNHMSYELRLDDEPVQTHRLVKAPEEKGNLPDGWYNAVQDCVWVRQHEIPGQVLAPGEHIIGIRLRHPNIMLEKLVLDLGGLKESYLGPPPSTYVQ